MDRPRFPSDVSGVVDHLFRTQYRKMVSTLTRVLGAQNLDLAESVVQDAVVKAMQTWPTQGVPENPTGWLIQVAKNQALDAIRRGRFQEDTEGELEDSFALLATTESEIASGEAAHFSPLLRDDQLRMIFTCCHPALSREARVALTLKTLCGFGLNEIARAFLAKADTIEQRITRAKQKIKEDRVPYEIPEPREIAARLDSVLDVFYLLFNEGYSATEGDELIRRDLCEDAIRLTALLTASTTTSAPKVHALLALMLFQSSRFDSRVNSDGDLLLLSDQDRSQWDREKIARGFIHLNQSAEGDELTDYHLQASIAACHAAAPDYESTNWAQILSDYDELILRNHTPVIALNRAVAVGMVHGPQTAIDELEKVRELPPLNSYYLLPATLAEFHSRLGNSKQAAEFYSEALKLARTDPEKRFLSRKLSGTLTKVSASSRARTPLRTAFPCLSTPGVFPDVKACP